MFSEQHKQHYLLLKVLVVKSYTNVLYLTKLKYLVHVSLIKSTQQ